jgi:hypothetical protein
VIISRATFTYVVMVAVFVGGLWVILSFGSTLRPPMDLAGKWEITSANGTEEMNIEQSGRFLNVVTPRWTGDLKVDSQSTDSAKVSLSGSGASASFEGMNLDDTCTIRFQGPIAGTYQARRTVRAHPKITAATKPR